LLTNIALIKGEHLDGRIDEFPRWAAVAKWKTLQLLVLVAAATVVLGALAAFVYVKSGIYNVAASKPHTNFTEWLTHETMIHSVRSHAKGIVAPPIVTADQVARGYCTYETHCVACHGAAAVARQHWVSGLEPQPPYLLDASHQWKPRELFWIVKNGIKMTGMPSWRDSLTDRQIWDVVAWLKASSQLPPQTYLRWRAGGRCAALSGLPSPALLPTRRP
jgi:mono/diheme cytochrome c family protein